MANMKWLFLVVISCVIAINAEEECIDGDGITILGRTYDCSYLSRRQETTVGIYNRRAEYCNDTRTPCCATCKNICWNDGAGVYIAEMYKSCKYLLQYYPEDRNVGIYRRRRFWCEQRTTACCKSCEIVLSQPIVTETTPASMTTKPTSSVTTANTGPVTVAPIPDDVVDTCASKCIWMADGHYGNCSWILDPKEVLYHIRLGWCNGGFASGCSRSCYILKNQGKIETSTKAPITSPTTKSTPAGCHDNGYIVVGRTSYYCSDLVTLNSDIYNNRKTLCDQAIHRDKCCNACSKVDKEKPAGVIRYSEENTAVKSPLNNQASLAIVQNVLRQIMEEFNKPKTNFENFVARLFGRFKVKG
ncbi:hypothetical protein ACF0H5_002706 [Mactra antiquata]